MEIYFENLNRYFIFQVTVSVEVFRAKRSGGGGESSITVKKVQINPKDKLS